MKQLKMEEYSIVKPLFARLNEDQPMSASVLEGAYPGRVYVDDADPPRAALLLTWIESEATGVWAFLAGDSGEAFNREVNAAVFGRSILDPRAGMMFWTCDPGDWGGHLDEVFQPLTPIWIPRDHFVARRISFDWRAALPEGFILVAIDDALRRGGLDLPGDIAATLDKWRLLEQQGFRKQAVNDYGVVVLDNRGQKPVIASWASVDFIVNGSGDLGFFTQEEYRNHGLGTIAAAAVIEKGLQWGLQQINWTCEKENLGSSKTANKLGLEWVGEYQSAFLLLDEEKHRRVYQQYAIEG